MRSRVCCPCSPSPCGIRCCLIALLGYAAIYAYVAPWQLPATRWYTWAIAILGVDLLYYRYHRSAHRIRLMWATHQAHHSSQYFNFATALRQKWNNSGEILMWIPLPLLGIPPWMVFFNVWKLQTHEYRSIAGDFRSATCLRDRVGYVFGPPGWQPSSAA